MTITEKNKLRLQFLARVITKEVKHLIQTDERLFLYSFTLEQATKKEGGFNYSPLFVWPLHHCAVRQNNRVLRLFCKMTIYTKFLTPTKQHKYQLLKH